MSLVYKSLVKTYYRQNAGQFSFLFFIMVLAVGRANDAGLLEYHYRLIRGMLVSQSFLAVVLSAWLLYGWKCVQYVAFTLRRKEYSFLYVLAQMDRARVYWLLLGVQVLLYLPVWLYVGIVLGVGYHQHWWLPATEVLVYNLVLCLVSAWRYLYLLYHPGSGHYAGQWRIRLFGEGWYSNILLRYVLTTRRVLLLVIKLYSCGVLYLMIRNGASAEYDMRMVLLFYSFGLLGHGVLIHRVKEMEETGLILYRGLPVSLGKRFVQYGWFYFLLFLPEVLTMASLTPRYLSYTGAAFLVGFGYVILLLLNSLLLFNFSRMADYLKVVGGIFFIIYAGVLAGLLPWVTVLFGLWSVGIFFSRYYRFERG